MALILDAAWHVQKVLSLAGLAFALMGVSIFGWHFVSLNAQAARSDSGSIPEDSWRGPGAKLGLRIFAGGVILAIASMALSAMLPGRYY